MKRVCKDCGKEFTISDSEIQFYKDKNLELPKRCSECRSKNKLKNDKEYENKDNQTNNKKFENTINESNRNTIDKKSNNKTFRNALITAIILIASFFGWNVNSFLNTAYTKDINESTVEQNYSLTFRNDTLLEDHFEKHKNEFNYKNKEEYLKGAIEVVNSSSSKHKTESEDGDEIYYNEEKNEIVFVSKDGYIRTYFKPSDGINYYNRQ